MNKEDKAYETKKKFIGNNPEECSFNVSISFEKTVAQCIGWLRYIHYKETDERIYEGMQKEAI